MTTIIINDKSTGAKKMIEYLKTLPYAKIIEESEFNAGVQKSFNEAKTGKVTRGKNVDELLQKLKK